MRKAFAVMAAMFLLDQVSAHAGLYHLIFERPSALLPAIGVTLAFILGVYLLEKLRKKKEIGGKISELF